MSRNDWKQAVGDSIRRQRLALGLTQAEVAGAVDASVASISAWESGRGEMGAYTHERLKAYFRKLWAQRELAGGAR